MRQHPRRSTNAQLNASRGIRRNGFMTIDSDPIQQLMRDLDSKEGRKVIRHSARLGLEVINDQTSENAKDLKLKKSGKGWRKMLQKRSSYKYKFKNTGRSNFSAVSGINYRKPILRISHLVERGFNHISGTRVWGNWFREHAFATERDKVMKVFATAMGYGLEMLSNSGKAPGLKTLRSLSK